ncbi:MAG: hypothetical protein FWF18_01785 [Dehalococcoidia bacterium]|nr:hypothetical protein [Dehalococcoidia bacterium]
MAHTWQNYYDELKKYIADHPAIKITPKVVTLFDDERPEFYRLFDAVRTAFVRERFAAQLEKAYDMGRGWKEACDTVKSEMFLEGIDVQSHLKWFLDDPVYGLMHWLFDPLFDLLKDKIDLDGFIAAGDAVVSERFRLLYREGYERWGTLALLHLLAPDRLWLGKTHDFYTDNFLEKDIVEGLNIDWVHDPEESKKLVFNNLIRASFVVPDVLVHTPKLNTYIGLRAGWYAPRWNAKEISRRHEWVDLLQLYRDYGTGQIWPDLTLLAADERPEELRLMADHKRMARPDVIIEFMEEDEWWDAAHVEAIIRHDLVSNPRFGTFIISRAAVPGEAFQPLPEVELPVPPAPPVEDVPALSDASLDENAPVEPVENVPAAPVEPPPPPKARPLSLAELPQSVQVISVGYDMAKLAPVMEAMKAAAAHAKEVFLKAEAAGE